MSRFFPPAEYAKDQKYARTILAIHRVDLGVKLGAFGSLAWPLIPLLELFPIEFTPSLRSTGTGTMLGIAAMGFGFFRHRPGEGEAEWKQEAWKLLGNKEQRSQESWTCVGLVAGLGYAGVKRGPGFRANLGVVGHGSLMSYIGYASWTTMKTRDMETV